MTARPDTDGAGYRRAGSSRSVDAASNWLTGGSLSSGEPAGELVYEIGRARPTLESGQQVTGEYVVIWKQEDGDWKWHIDSWNLNSA